jgi:hypothetical protein
MVGRAGKAFLLLVICAFVAGVTASVARADEAIVNPFICQTFQGGNVTVAAGSTITIRQGAAEQTLGILMDLLNAQTSTITINGTSVDVSGSWSAPEGPEVRNWGWASRVVYPTGVTLAAGDSLVVTWTTTLAHAIPEVFNPGAGGPSGQPVFNAESVTYTCTVTAV